VSAQKLLTERGELRRAALSPPVVAAELAGVAGVVAIFLLADPDRGVTEEMAGASGTVFALIAGAGVPLLYSVADRRMEYWTTRLTEGKDVGDAASQLQGLVRSLCVVILGAIYLLIATVLSVIAAYSSALTGDWLDALLATAFGFMLAGLGLTLCFIFDTARLSIVVKVRHQLLKVPNVAAGQDRRRSPPTQADIDALVNAATPHFALQLRDCLVDSLAALPADDPLRTYGAAKVKELEALATAG
jgi:hypothetical protein